MSDFLPVLILLVIIILVMLLVKKFSPDEAKRYDERQVLTRGKAYKHAFLVTIWSALLYAIIVNFITQQPIANEGVIPALIALLGLGVFAVSSIINDAFLAINKKPASFFVIFALAAVTNGFSAVLNIIDGKMLENGLLAFPAMQVGCAVLFTIVFITLAVKLIQSKKSEAEE